MIEFIKGRQIEQIIIDPSAASFIAELKTRGLSIRKAKNDVIDGIRVTGVALDLGRIKILDNCVNTIKEFSNYIWDKKAADRGEDKPIKDHDHCMDALRYFCFTILNNESAFRITRIGR